MWREVSATERMIAKTTAPEALWRERWERVATLPRRGSSSCRGSSTDVVETYVLLRSRRTGAAALVDASALARRANREMYWCEVAPQADD